MRNHNQGLIGYIGPTVIDSTDHIERLLDEMIESQRARLLSIAWRIDPSLTSEDLLQPHDHPAIAASPEFNFEDGILAGYLAIRAALRANGKG